MAQNTSPTFVYSYLGKTALVALAVILLGSSPAPSVAADTVTFIPVGFLDGDDTSFV